MKKDKTTLKRARAAVGLTQEDAARELGVTVRTIRSFETGALIKEETLAKLCKMYRINKRALDLDIETTHKYKSKEDAR